MISRALLYQLRIEKIFSKQSHANHTNERHYRRCQIPFYAGHFSLHQATFLSSFWQQGTHVLFSTEISLRNSICGWRFRIWHLLFYYTFFLGRCLPFFCFPLKKKIVKFPLQRSYEKRINHFVVFKKYFSLLPLVRNKIYKSAEGLILSCWYLKGNMHVLLLSQNKYVSVKGEFFFEGGSFK